MSSDQQALFPLFDEPEPPLRAKLREALSRLAAGQQWIGTSSWKYPGWLGQIYTEERYQVRGRLSQKKFEAECLREYAEVFPIVCGDFAFYQFPTAAFWQRLFGAASEPLQFAFKIPEEVTVPVFPDHPRCGGRAGQINSNFLSSELLESELFQLLEPYAERVAVLIFEFPASVQRRFTKPVEFAEVLAPFLSCLPRRFRYAVEIRHEELLTPAHFRALEDHGVAHVFSSWSGMPSLSDQMQIGEAYTAPYTVARALLKPGRKYDEAVRLFAPYTAIRDPLEEVREALRALLWRSKSRSEPTYMFINNRLEGFAPGTIEAVIGEL
jgi:uncharacterized protein YecE (DUF72 family)